MQTPDNKSLLQNHTLLQSNVVVRSVVANLPIVFQIQVNDRFGFGEIPKTICSNALICGRRKKKRKERIRLLMENQMKIQFTLPEIAVNPIHLFDIYVYTANNFGWSFNAIQISTAISINCFCWFEHTKREKKKIYRQENHCTYMRSITKQWNKNMEKLTTTASEIEKNNNKWNVEVCS